MEADVKRSPEFLLVETAQGFLGLPHPLSLCGCSARILLCESIQAPLDFIIFKYLTRIFGKDYFGFDCVKL